MSSITTVEEFKRSINNIDNINKPASYVVINGCFDLLHAGHISLIRNAKKRLTKDSEPPFIIVGLNSDESIKRLKGESRPIVSQEQRLFSVSALKFVDYCFLFEGDDFSPYLSVVNKPQYVKGADYDSPSKAELAALSESGGKWVQIKSDYTCSTSQIIEALLPKTPDVRNDS